MLASSGEPSQVVLPARQRDGKANANIQEIEEIGPIQQHGHGYQKAYVHPKASAPPIGPLPQSGQDDTPPVQQYGSHQDPEETGPRPSQQQNGRDTRDSNSNRHEAGSQMGGKQDRRPFVFHGFPVPFAHYACDGIIARKDKGHKNANR